MLTPETNVSEVWHGRLSEVLVSIRQTFSPISSETLKKRAVEIPTRAEKIVAR